MSLDPESLHPSVLHCDREVLSGISCEHPTRRAPGTLELVLSLASSPVSFYLPSPTPQTWPGLRQLKHRYMVPFTFLNIISKMERKLKARLHIYNEFLPHPLPKGSPGPATVPCKACHLWAASRMDFSLNEAA